MHATPAAARSEFDLINPDNYHDYKVSGGNRLRGTWSKSELFYAATSPHEFGAGIKKEYRACMSIGSLVDMLMTEPHLFGDTYVVTEETDGRKKAYQDAKKQAEEEGKTLLKQTELETAEAMIDAVTNHPEGKKMIKGDSQRVFTSTLQLEGPAGIAHVALKSKTDFTLQEDQEIDVWDLKCTGATDDEGIAKIARNLGYAMQDVLYTKNIGQNGLHVRSFKFVFVCSEPPHRVRVVEFDDEAMAGAVKMIQKGFSVAYALGTGKVAAQLEDAKLLLGRRRDAMKNYWDVAVDLRPEDLVNVIW